MLVRVAMLLCSEMVVAVITALCDTPTMLVAGDIVDDDPNVKNPLTVGKNVFD